MIRLSEYSDSHFNNVKNIQIHEFQRDFVCTPEDLINRLNQDRINHAMCVILFAENPCGVFLMKELAPKEYFLWEMMIDKHYQNRGIGKMAISDLIIKLKNTHAKKISTTIKKNNNTALNLFLRSGFKITNEIDDNINLEMEIYYD